MARQEPGRVGRFDDLGWDKCLRAALYHPNLGPLNGTKRGSRWVELAKEILARGRNYRKRHDTDVEASIEIERAPDDHEAKARDAAEAAEAARVKYEGPDPTLRSIADSLRRQFKLGPSREQ